MNLIDITNEELINLNCINKFHETLGEQALSFSLEKQIDKALLFKIILKSSQIHERVVLATYDNLPDRIELTNYSKYFSSTPIMDSSKSVMIIKFDEQKVMDSFRVYGFNPQLINE